jgi:Zn-dependent protease with chaperone function
VTAGEKKVMICRRGSKRRKNFTAVVIFAWFATVPSVVLGVERLPLKPGFNLFSPQQDVQVGKESSAQVDKQMPLVNDPPVLQYVNSLGKKLASYAPHNNSEYAWQFKVVNSTEINAFALPGGFIYVNRGAIEAAEDEAQLAGVLAHESGHVVMRHGTHMASQAMLAEAPLAILGGLLGESGSITAQLAQIGIGLGVNSLLLKNSRSAESQADEVGTYILYQAGYDPRAMAQFFQIIEQKYPQRTLQFFSDHPNPENRIKAVDAEIARLGPPRGTKTDSPEFEASKRRLAAMPPPPKAQGVPRAGAHQPPPPPSEHMIRFDGKVFALSYPDNWQVQRSEDGVALFPPGGMVTGPEGETAQAYGAAVSRYRPRQENWGLVDATQELVESMRQSNPNLRVVQQTGLSLQGRSAVSTLLHNDSPIAGQRETDHLVTLRQGDYLLALIFIAPEGTFESYRPAFDKILESVELSK